MSSKKIQLRSYTLKELRSFYGVPLRTFNSWLAPYREELKIGKAKYLTIKQVQFIFEKFGIPGTIETT